MSHLFSYVVARDFGFAPNPFHGFCTLATCHEDIRSVAQEGDWVMGTGAKYLERADGSKVDYAGHLIFLMEVDQTIDFDEYWTNPKFKKKRPIRASSGVWANGDNIYPTEESGLPAQIHSHHSYPDGSIHAENMAKDKSANVLVAKRFWYFGRSAPEIDPRFRSFVNPQTGVAVDVCKRGEGFKYHPLDCLKDDFIRWVSSEWPEGLHSQPISWM